MLKKCLAIFFMLCGFGAVAQAQEPSSPLIALLQNLHTMQGTFSQTMQDARGSTLQQSQGQMALQRPGLFRWETTQPNQQLIVADGKAIWIYDQDLQQVTKQRQNSSVNAPGLLLSDSVEHLAQRFTIHPISTTANTTGFKLTPKGKRDLFQSVDLYFANNVLQQMILHDNLGQTTQIQFSKVKTNTTLSTTLFRFQPPAGVDVVTG